jgi:hypothetical protein
MKSEQIFLLYRVGKTNKVLYMILFATTTSWDNGRFNYIGILMEVVGYEIYPIE